MALINYHARIVVCGQTSQYNESNATSGAITPNLLVKSSARMEGFGKQLVKLAEDADRLSCKG